MNKKQQRELNGPSLTEVLLGAALSLVLGAALAAAFLIFTPVATVKELPKELTKGVVYYIEGSRDASKARQATAKQKTFVEGGTVTVNEDEINAIATPTAAPAAKAAADAAKPAAQTLNAGAPNFRIRNDLVQIAVPVELNALGLQQKLVYQTRGTFVKRGEVFEFVPSETFLGSCPLHRLPALDRAVSKRIIAQASIPEGVSTAWSKLTEVAVEGANLRLSVQ